jgi:hypothetical protein
MIEDRADSLQEIRDVINPENQRFVRTVKILLSSPPKPRVKNEKAPAPTDASSSR